MQPIPNNGTLRLPLSPVGLHDSESPLEELPDPAETPTNDNDGQMATGMMSILPVETYSLTSEEDLATGLVSILPVETSSQGETDPTDDEAETQPVSDDDDDDDEGDDSKHWWENAWDWVSDKFDSLVGTIKGSEEGS